MSDENWQIATINGKCIYCGMELTKTYNPCKIKCTNLTCPNPIKEWTVAEHIDNQNWEINKMRELETKINELQTLISNLTLAFQNHIK